MILMPLKVSALPEDNIVIHYFYQDGWSLCMELGEFFEDLQVEYPDVVFIKYDIRGMYGGKIFSEVLEMYNFNPEIAGTPFVVIGDYVISGNSDGFQDRYRKVLSYYQNNFYNDVVGVHLGNATENVGEDNIYDFMDSVPIPFFGEVDLVNSSLLMATFMLGVADGFNPCAMWVLIFLISIMITMKDRKRMWILGLSFIITSSVIYFLFMSAWLNVALVFNERSYIRIGIGSFAICMGLYSLKKWYDSKDGAITCDVTDGKFKKKITDRIIKFTSEKSLVLALIGVITLAISINAIELLCSLGLPLIYTKFLTLADLNKPTYYGYILLYTFFFMLDDIIVFSLAMYTMKITSTTQKFTKLSKLVGGIIMLLIGILLIFFPTLLA